MCTQKENLCTTIHIVLNASNMCVCKHNCTGLVEAVRIRLDAHATPRMQRLWRVFPGKGFRSPCIIHG